MVSRPWLSGHEGAHQGAGGPGQSAGLLPSLQGGSVTLPGGGGVADGGSRGRGGAGLGAR